MNTPVDPQKQEQELAQFRYGLLHLVRIFALGLVIMGFAIANDVRPAPYFLSWVFGVVGLVTFFFAPPLLSKHWKAKDRGEK